jgi:hypothetical protein
MSETGRRLAQPNLRSKKNPQARGIIFGDPFDWFRWVSPRCAFALKNLAAWFRCIQVERQQSIQNIISGTLEN